VRPDAHQRSTHCSTSSLDHLLPLAMWLKIGRGLSRFGRGARPVTSHHPCASGE
jgi:hypothetical protein